MTIFRGKKNKKYEENLLGELMCLIGAYDLYTANNNDDKNFIKYFEHTYTTNTSIYFFRQKKGRQIIKELLSKKNIRLSNKKINRVYRRNIRRVPKINSNINMVMETILDYVLNNETLKTLFYEYFLKNCSNFNLPCNTINPYEECILRITKFVYHWIIEVINRNNGSRKATKCIICLENMRTYVKNKNIRDTCIICRQR